MKKFIYIWLASVACLLLLPSVFAQVTNAAPAFDPATAPLPSGKTELWTWVISIVTPLIVYGFGKVPQLPRPILPILTPVIGVVLGLIMRKLGALNLSWVDMAQAGAVAVFIRESVNQLITKQMKPLEDSKTNAKPVDGAVAVPLSSQPTK